MFASYKYNIVSLALFYRLWNQDSRLWTPVCLTQSKSMFFNRSVFKKEIVVVQLFFMSQYVMSTFPYEQKAKIDIKRRNIQIYNHRGRFLTTLNI